ncbi:hypothetical protein KR018_009861 [Drosophila ironensis]|nr:hypothetical protein KR018_009861 [Drosophila ironensis]
MSHNICRICSRPETAVNLFQPENMHLLRQILSVTGVALNDSSELPRHLCPVCVGDLEGAILFRQRCIISEKRNLERITPPEDKKECAEAPVPVDPIDDRQIELYINEEEAATSSQTEAMQGTVEIAILKEPKTFARAGPYICEDCGKSINHWTNFQEHKLRHTGIKNFKCEFGDCGKCFATRKELTRHIRSHTGEQPFACSYCPRRFSDVSSRQQHQRRHRNERTFRCDECDKSFVSSGCLSKHKMTHSSKKQRQH